MAVRLVSETERNVFEYEGSKFYYRRISATQNAVIHKKHVKRGLLDSNAFGIEVVQWCLIDWEGVEGEGGAAIPFTKELVLSLPDDLVLELSVALRESSPVETQLGN